MSRALVKLLCKLIQRQTYSCLSTKYGIILCIGGVLLTLISLLQFGEVLLEWSMQKYSLSFNIYHDNVGGRSYQDRLCLPIPIDVVYTWVNGSDPKLLRQLQILKNQLENTTNDKAGLANSTSERAGNIPRTRIDPEIICSYADCTSARIAVVVNSFKGRNLNLQNVQSMHISFKSISEIREATSKGVKKDNLVLLYFPNSDSTHNALVHKIKLDNKQIELYQGYFTTDGTIEDSTEAKREIIVTGFQKYTDLAELHKDVLKKFGQKVSDISYDPKKHIGIVYFTNEVTRNSALEQYEGNYTIHGGATLHISRAHLMWTHSWSYFKSNPIGNIYDKEDHIISANRFADNQELKYSLRSIEKFSPWVRNVYIVTNGQIPSWLNLDNPRVKIITHKEIFVNQSHLPTFSSPAIESHLHRIPGLSKKFIYMNDDVMFGDSVWPDDFYTHSNGQKIFLTWAVPNCNEGCPASWIQDKYCDKACNVSACDYDGGDCLGVKQTNRYSYQNWQNQQSRFKLDFCNTGCADTWVGDRYCDVACNVYNCGFDAGDCGIAQFDTLYSVDVVKNNHFYYLPSGLKVVYFNLSNIFHDAKLTGAEHSENQVVRTATVAQKFKILSLTLRSNYSLTSISFSISGTINKTQTVIFDFNVTLTTVGTFEMSTKIPFPTLNPSESNPTIPISQKVTDFKAIKIIYSNQSINYWMAINSTLPKPTWMAVDQEIYNVPLFSNETVLPEHVRGALKNLDKELDVGDITEKGYRRRKAKLLRDYLKINGNDDNGRIAKQSLELDTRNDEEKTANGKNKRHLLSTDDFEQDEFNSPYQPFDLTNYMGNFHPVPSEDELFLANWIANSKQKQLSLETDLKKSSQEWHKHYGNWNPQKDSTETSFLPWERQRFFKRSHIVKEERKMADKYETQGQTGRRLLDTFADSLLHVHNLFNRKFGYAGRKVPAHMPHMIDVDIMKELQDTFPEEFDKTSSHKLRSSDDMQFAFSYNYFVIGQTKTLNVTKLFAELDTDNSGALSDRELRTLATKIYTLPLKSDDIKNLERTLINCSLSEEATATATSTSQHKEENSDFAMPLVTESLLSLCTEVTKLLNESKGASKKFKHETAGDEDIAFKMISNNASMVLKQLDNIRAHKKKFICLNDNIDHSQNATIVRALLVDFYESLFPKPSHFELPRNYRNRFLYVEDFERWKEEQKEAQKKQHIIVIIIVFFLVLVTFRRKVIHCLRRLCPLRRRFIPSASETSNTRLLTI